ncbi:hypothetical protein MMC22_001453 [Lobaria immixta]|nr:hypothetical protein [Lobaria immixta]
MDGLSATAGVIAVGSITIQLFDGVKKLRDIGCSVKDAPNDVRAIAGDLEILSHILTEINIEAQDKNAFMKAALLRCIDRTKPLAATVEDLEPGFESKSTRTRKWSALRMAFRGEKIQKYQSFLDRMKTSLILAQQSHYGTPLVAAAYHNYEAIITRAGSIDTIRLFLDTLDFSGYSSSGWWTTLFLLGGLNYFLDKVDNDDIETLSLIERMLRSSASDIKENMKKGSFPILLALSSLLKATEVSSLLLTFNSVDATEGFGGDSALHLLFCWPHQGANLDSGLNLMLNNSANLHLAGQISPYSAKPGCFLAFVSRSQSFVEEELRHSPSRDAGWKEDSLLDLFCCVIQSSFVTLQFRDCDDCSLSKSSSIHIELSWQKWLNHFKAKANIENSNNENSGPKRDQNADCFMKPKSPSLQSKENLVNDFRDEKEVVDETATRDLYESETESSASDTYFRSEMGYICMRCDLKRQGYKADV